MYLLLVVERGVIAVATQALVLLVGLVVEEGLVEEGLAVAVVVIQVVVAVGILNGLPAAVVVHSLYLQ